MSRRLLVVLVGLCLLFSVLPAAVADSGGVPSPIEQAPTDGEPGSPPVEAEEPVFDVEEVASRRSERVKAPNSDVVADELARPGLQAGVERITGAVDPDEVGRVRFDMSGFPVSVETDRGAIPDGSDVVLEVVDPTLVGGLSPFGAVFDIRFLDSSSRKVKPSDGVRVSVDFTDVQVISGGGVQERLRLALFTGCTERDGIWSCSGTERLETSLGEGRVLTATLSADQVELLQGAVSRPSSDGFRMLSGGPDAYFGIVTSPDGPNGNFAAGTSPGPASFEIGLQAGTAELSYSVSVPPAPYGPTPDVTLSYSSAVPDGMSAAENTQASWVGLGWSLSAGSITRHYETCDDTAHEGDLCDAGDFYSLTLGGVSSPLIQDSGDIFRLASDPNWRVTRKEDTNLNPDDEGEWWEVTTTDGTVFEFGHNRSITGWYAMNSVQTVWVHSPDAGGACDDFTGDSCDKGWRWDLSTVRDTHDNEATFHYTQEENEFHSGDGGTLKEYVRAAHLYSIKYANGRVDFVTDTRCADEEPCTGSAEEFPDVPWDLECPGSCQDSPSFWSGVRLREITTGVWHQSSWQDAGKWELDYSFPDPPQDEDDDGYTAASYPKLWLDEIEQVDVIGSPAATVPATKFYYEWLDNRVNHPAGVAAMTMARLDVMTNELGGETRFTYGQTHPCTVEQSYTASQHQNLDCFRAWDLTQDDPPEPGIVMWHKYKVLTSTQDPMLPTGSGNRAEPVTTTYTYGAPQWVEESGPLPPQDSPSGILWTEFRGHEDVTATMSSGDYTDYRFHRGLGGTYTLSDSTQVTDHDQLNGQLAEVSSHESGGTMLGRTITQYESSQTASMSSDNGTQYAHWVAPDIVKTTTKGATRTDTSRVEYDYDSYGNVTFERLLGDNSAGEAKRTVRYEYTANTTKHIVNRPKVVSLGSGWRNANNPAAFADQLARTEILYYNNTYYWNSPTKGDPTHTRVYYQDLAVDIAAYYYHQSVTAYDSKGRVTSFTDAESNATSFDFDTFGHVDEVTNPLSQDTLYVTDPKLGVVTQVTDPNSEVTKADYDGLGRLLGVERPTDPSGTDGVAYTYTYPDRENEPSTDDTMVLTTTSLLESSPNVFVTAATHYDGLGRVVQTDAPRPQNAAQAVVRLVDFDADGRLVREGIPFQVSNTPGAAYVAGDVWTSWGVVHDETTYSGNTTTVTRKQGSTTVWSSQSVSDGWEVETTNPEDNDTTYENNAFGQLIEVEEHNGAATYTTDYAYDLSGNLTSVTDDDSNTTSMTYDRLGQKRTMDDPDSGDWTYVYDKIGNLTSQQDGESDWLFFEYDDVNRVLKRRADSASGTVLAEYAYDSPYVVRWAGPNHTHRPVKSESTTCPMTMRVESCPGHSPCPVRKCSRKHSPTTTPATS